MRTIVTVYLKSGSMLDARAGFDFVSGEGRGGLPARFDYWGMCANKISVRPLGASLAIRFRNARKRTMKTLSMVLGVLVLSVANVFQ